MTNGEAWIPQNAADPTDRRTPSRPLSRSGRSCSANTSSVVPDGTIRSRAGDDADPFWNQR